MRHLGSLEEEQLALRFHDYMLARGMTVRVDREGDEWALWVIEEDHVDAAREELETFLTSPNDEKYVEAASSAEHIRRERAAKQKAIRRRTRQVGREWDAQRRRGPVVTTWLVILSVALCFASLNWEEPLRDGFGGFNLRGTALLRAAFITEPDAKMQFWSNGPTLWDHVRQGQVWRLVTPMLIHLGPLHLLFNMMWLRQLGSAIEMRRGHWRYLGIVLVISVVSNLAQYWFKGPAFGGMSGVVFGLFGYVWMKSKYDPLDGFYVPPNVVFLMIAWLFICTTGAVGAIANYAHGFGLAAGCIIAMIPVWRRWLRPPAGPQ